MLTVAAACARNGDVTPPPDGSNPAPAPRPGATATAATSPGASAVPSGDPNTSSRPPPRENPRVVSAGATALRETSGTADAGDDCPLGGSGGYTRDGCASGSLPGGEVAALWEKRQSGGDVAGTFRVTVYQRTSAGWAPRFRATFEPDTLSGVAALEAKMDGGPFLLVGYRSLGSGSDLAYDAIAFPRGGRVRVVAHRAELTQGSVKVGRAGIVDYGAALGPSDAACCPSRFTRTSIAWSSGAFRITAQGSVPPSAVPASDL
jgi:hypothetical protein